MAFDFNPLRATGIALVKNFGRPVQCILLRNINGTPDDAAKPWRGAAPNIKQFKFTGTVSTLKDLAANRDQKVIAPGDLVDTAAEGDPATLCGLPTIDDQIQIDDIEGTMVAQIMNVHDVTPGAKPIIIVMRCKAWPQTPNQPRTPF